MGEINTLILAAGKGTRMKSHLHKVLQPVCGKAMVDHVLTEVEKLNNSHIVTIIGSDGEDIKECLGDRTEYVVQKEQLGTGHAVLQAEAQLGNSQGYTLVMSGDTPLFTSTTLQKLIHFHCEHNDKITILTSIADDPTGYGRIVRNNDDVVKIVEQKDASDDELKIKEINTGVYVFDNQFLFDALHKINNDNAQHEYYLTDVIKICKDAKEKVSAYIMDDFNESLGVNDRIALARATKIMQRRINLKHMNNGVSIVDPEHTFIDIDVKIGADTVIESNVHLRGKTIIGNNCVIKSGSDISNSVLHDNVTVISSNIEDSEMEDNSDIGPMSHLRPNAHIGKFVHIGNFVEVKKATIGDYTKVGHLTYIGNAKLGSNINVGCGVVFVNYDGKDKHESIVGDHSFLGSNSNIVAPVNISDHSFIAAGSTITDNVNYHDLAIARARQVNKENYWDRLPHKPEDL